MTSHIWNDSYDSTHALRLTQTWHDFTYLTWLMPYDSLKRDMPHPHVTWLHIYDMTHALRLTQTWHASPKRDMTSHICPRTHSNVTVMSYMWSHVTLEWGMSRIHESCHTWMSHATYGWVMSHTNESCHIWMSHVTYEWVMSRANKSCTTFES